MATRKAAPKRSPSKQVSIGGHRAGSPPPGSVGQDAVERLVTQWLRLPKRRADHLKLPRRLLLEEARWVLAAPQDLEVFVDEGTPIHRQAFDYVEMLCQLTEALPRERITPPRAIPDNPRTRSALSEAGRALGAVLRRAEACARPIRLYELGRPAATGGLFITQLLSVVHSGRRRVEKWDDPEQAAMLFDRLEDAAVGVEDAWGLRVTGAPSSAVALRGVGLGRLLYDAVTYVAAYGRAVFPPSDTRYARYMLGRLFPTRGTKGIPPPLRLLA